LKSEADRVRAEDIVRVEDPTPPGCVNALAKESGVNSRDYAFVPGTSSFDITMAELLQARPLTVRINKGIGSLTGFIRSLGSSNLIKNPIRDIIIASHANTEGNLFIEMTAGAGRAVTYEDLEDAVKSKAIAIDDAVIQPRPTDTSGKPVAAQFLIRGCRIGSALPFLKKLKEALGNKIPVVAPKHFHVVAHLRKPAGLFEYMAYNFAIHRPEQLRDRAAIIAAFKAADLKRIDGKPVEAKEWETWIPTKNLGKQGPNNWPNKVVNPVTNVEEDAPKTFRYTVRKLLSKPGSFAVAVDPGTLSKRKELLKAELMKLDRYTEKHAYPEYVRLGYTNLADFMDGWDWKFQPSKGTMFYNGTRHEYAMMQPIVEKNTLVLNFYPTHKHGSVIEMLKPTDGRFFATER
jgi:hypothetical protein